MNLSIDEIVMCLESLRDKVRTFEEELLYRKLDDAYIRHQQGIFQKQRAVRVHGGSGHAHS